MHVGSASTFIGYKSFELPPFFLLAKGDLRSCITHVREILSLFFISEITIYTVRNMTVLSDNMINGTNQVCQVNDVRPYG